MTIRVAIADDQPLLLAGLVGIINTAPDIDVIGQATSGVEAVELASSLHPDVVLMDIRMPTMNGIEATTQITRTGSSRVLILTTFDIDEYVYAALRAGASGFLLKDTPPTQLIEAIRVVAGGDSLLSPSVTKRLLDEFAARPANGGAEPETVPALSSITTREHEVFTLLAQGMSNAEIAERLYIGIGTVKTHVGSLLTKLGARDRIQLVIIAYQTGLAG